MPLGFVVVIIAASSVQYLLERDAQADTFGSIRAALWWGIVTMTNSGCGDNVPQTLTGRMLAGIVMICGIVVLALIAGILATAFAQEIRKHAFLRTWDIVATVSFLYNDRPAARSRSRSSMMQHISVSEPTARNGCASAKRRGTSVSWTDSHARRLDRGATRQRYLCLCIAPRCAI